MSGRSGFHVEMCWGARGVQKVGRQDTPKPTPNRPRPIPRSAPNPAPSQPKPAQASPNQPHSGFTLAQTDPTAQTGPDQPKPPPNAPKLPQNGWHLARGNRRGGVGVEVPPCVFSCAMCVDTMPDSVGANQCLCLRSPQFQRVDKGVQPFGRFPMVCQGFEGFGNIAEDNQRLRKAPLLCGSGLGSQGMKQEQVKIRQRLPWGSAEGQE